MTMNLNTAASIDAIIAGMPSDGQQAFSPITSQADFEKELDKGSSFGALLDNVVATGHAVGHHAIALAVHVAQAMNSNPAFRKVIEDRAANYQIDYKGSNAYGLVSRVMFGELVTSQGPNGTTNTKWVPNRTLSNRDRHIRYFVDNSVPACDVVAAIAAASVKVGKDKITKLDAIAYWDLQAHPLTQAQRLARSWGTQQVQNAVQAVKPVTSVAMPKINFNSHGYALVVVRKAANGNAEILFDADLSEKTIQMGVRNGIKKA